MIRNYIKVALRNILKYKFFSLINLAGLTIGMTCCLLIFIYVKDEISYDKFHDNAENIYRVGLHGRLSGQEIYATTTSLPVGSTMQNEIPGIESTVRVVPATSGSGITFRVDDKIFTEENVSYADSNFFEFFSFKLIHGDVNTLLKEPNSIVISEKLAKKYFGDEEAVGKVITVGNDKLACNVTGVFEEVPSNSHFRFDALISFITVSSQYFQGWTGNSIQTYVVKNPATNVDEVNSKLEDIVERYAGKELEEGLGINFDEFRKKGGIYAYFIYPMTDSHLYSTLVGDEGKGDIRYVYIFSGVGLFILVLACINFMNLSTARSAGRAKEVGLRKSLGSQRGEMIWQFLAESFVYSLIAIILAVAITYLILPQFNLLSGKELTLVALQDPLFIATVAVLIVIVGFLAGSYPAFYLTSFNTVEVLKGKLRAGMKSKGVRSTLVVAQFAVSTFLIIATVVVYMQLSFMQTKNLGLDQNGVINISNTRRLDKNRDAFKNSVLGMAGIQSASFTNNSFPGVNNTTVFRKKGVELDFLAGLYYADWDHLDVMRMKIKEGRFFSRDVASDSVACVLNEAAVREFGMTDPLNSTVIDFQGETPREIKVIGVIEDFNFEDLRTKVRPMVIELTKVSRNLLVRYEGDPQSTIASLENLWKENAPGEPFEYTFLDQDFDALFRAEMRLRDIFIVFSSLAILIACLGLFALAAFTTEQRTKEIGIRKALGASSFGLTLLLSKEFTKLVLIAVVPAVVGGWFVANWWLKDFAYRTEISPLIFVGCAVLALAISWLTVSFQSVKAAVSNPVDALRYE